MEDTLSDLRTLAARGIPPTVAQAIYNIAQGLGCIALPLTSRFGKGFLLVERTDDESRRKCIFARVQKQGEVHTITLRPLETHQRDWERDVAACGRLARRSLVSLHIASLPRDRAVNAEYAKRCEFPGGPHAWWRLITKEALSTYESVFGVVQKDRFPPRIKRDLERLSAPSKIRTDTPRKLGVMPKRQYWGEPKEKIRGSW